MKPSGKLPSNSFILRVSSNCHRYILLVNGKFRSVTTHEKDFQFDLSLLFAWLNRSFGRFAQLSLNRLVALALSVILHSPVAFALPSGWEVVSGEVTFDQQGTVLNVTSASQQAIVNYQSFNIGAGETVNFNFLLSGSSILNRVIGGGSSTIAGNLTGNGSILLVNPAGIHFAGSAHVNVGGMMASTLGIADHSYLSGHYVFQREGQASPIHNEGHLSAGPDGHVVLIGSAIQNDGSITAPRVTLAVGDQVTVAIGQDLSLQVTVDQALKEKVEAYQAAIGNTGGITAAQSVELKAEVDAALYQSVVNNDGVIAATGVSQEGGRIILWGRGADGNALVQNHGEVRAEGGLIRLEGDRTVNTGNLSVRGGADERGGRIEVLGDEVVLEGQAILDASGGLGGGEVLVGGNYQGQAGLRTADTTTVGQDVQLLANAGESGDGGRIIAWSNETTRFDGTAQARGGLAHGNGGLIETSGKEFLFVGRESRVDASAANGSGGTWLLDPTDLTIAAGAGANTVSTVYADNIQATLNTGTSVIVQTSGGGAQAGDLTVSGGVNISKTAGGDATLTLQAHQSILFNGSGGNAINISSSSNRLNIILNADTDQGADGGLGGAAKIFYTSLNTNGGNLIIGGGADPLANAVIGTAADNVGANIQHSTLTAGAGDISIRARGFDDAGAGSIQGIDLFHATINTTTGSISLDGTAGAGNSNNRGIYINTGTQITSIDGNISLTGTGKGSQGYNYGIRMDDTTLVETTGSGNITLNGTGGNGTTDNFGFYMAGSSARIGTVDGDISVLGTGGNGNSSGNVGMRIISGAKIRATGDGGVALTGIGGTGTNGQNGVMLTGLNTEVSTASGTLSMTGTGGSGTTDQVGIHIASQAKVRSTTGNITLSGQGGTGTSSNYGVYVLNNNSQITTVDGDINVIGTGGGTTINNYGIWVQDGQITATGDGNVTLNGTGGLGTVGNSGVVVSTGNGLVGVTNGLLNITGTGRGSQWNNHGVNVNSGGKIRTSGLGDVHISGTGSQGGVSNNHGIYMQQVAVIDSLGSGDITITGIQGAGGGSMGMFTTGPLNNTIGNNGMTGNLTLVADAYSFNNIQFRTGGELAFRPHTTGLGIGVNGGAGALALNNALLGLIDTSVSQPTRVILGDELAGTGAVDIGDNWDFSAFSFPVTVAGGTIVAGNINAGNNALVLLARTGNLDLNGVITSNAAGNAVTVVADTGHVSNNTGVGLFNLTGGGRWLAYSDDPATTTEGGLTFNTQYNVTFAGNPPGSIGPGNYFLYRSSLPLPPPVPTVTTGVDGTPFVLRTPGSLFIQPEQDLRSPVEISSLSLDMSQTLAASPISNGPAFRAGPSLIEAPAVVAHESANQVIVRPDGLVSLVFEDETLQEMEISPFHERVDVSREEEAESFTVQARLEQSRQLTQSINRLVESYFE